MPLWTLHPCSRSGSSHFDFTFITIRVVLLRRALTSVFLHWMLASDRRSESVHHRGHRDVACQSGIKRMRRSGHQRLPQSLLHGSASSLNFAFVYCAMYLPFAVVFSFCPS